MTKAQAAQAVCTLFAAYPQGDRQSDETVELYEALILDLDFELCRKAILGLIRSTKFIPTIAEIRTASAPDPEPTVGPEYVDRCNAEVDAILQRSATATAEESERAQTQLAMLDAKHAAKGRLS